MYRKRFKTTIPRSNEILDYIKLAPGYVREALEVYDKWNGQETLPMKIRELMMVLQIEVERRYKGHYPPSTLD
jgi:hypothetical protein